MNKNEKTIGHTQTIPELKELVGKLIELMDIHKENIGGFTKATQESDIGPLQELAEMFQFEATAIYSVILLLRNGLSMLEKAKNEDE